MAIRQFGGARSAAGVIGVAPGRTAKPFSDFSPAVVDVALQRKLRLQTPVGFDAAVQRLRQRLPPENELDRVVAANVLDAVPPLASSLRAQLKQRYRESNLAMASRVPFSIEDWL